MKRDLQLDGIRGVFLLIMAADHFEGLLRTIFYEKIGFFTAAAGFVFLSGFVAGMVYGKITSDNALIKKSFHRALVIYRYQLITVLLLFVLVVFVPAYRSFWGEHVPEYVSFPVIGFISSLFLLYDPSPLDILPLYFFFIMLMPFMILLLKRNKKVAFFMITLFLYFIGQFINLEPFSLILFTHKVATVNLGFFNFLSWQLIFFVGIFFGYVKWEKQRFIIPYTKPLIISSIIVCGLFFLWRLLFLLQVNVLFTDMSWPVYRGLFGKQNLGILRILNFLSFSYLMASILNYKKDFLTYKPLVFLGQHSIQAFTYHIAIYILFFPLYNIVATMNPMVNILYSISMLVLMYLAVVANNRLKESWARIRSI